MNESLFVCGLILVMILVGGVWYMFAHCEPDWCGNEPPHFKNFLRGCGIGVGLLIALFIITCVGDLVYRHRPDLHVAATAKSAVENYIASIDSVQNTHAHAHADK